jgi:hypothetical protein
MLKIFSIFLIYSYFLGTLGLKLNQHFCCGKLVAMELLWGQKPKDCSGKIPKEPKKCCKDEVKILQSDDAKQSFSDNQINPDLNFRALVPEFSYYFERTQSFESRLISNLANGPPENWKRNHLFLLHRSLVI